MVRTIKAKDRKSVGDKPDGEMPEKRKKIGKRKSSPQRGELQSPATAKFKKLEPKRLQLAGRTAGKEQAKNNYAVPAKSPGKKTASKNDMGKELKTKMNPPINNRAKSTTVIGDELEMHNENEFEADGIRVMIHANEDDFETESEVSDEEMDKESD